jgi:undecaprenyl pyrophosphate phosphatase UppP
MTAHLLNCSFFRLSAQPLSQYFLGMDQERFGLTCDAAIHTGTVLAVVWFF